MRGIKPAIKNAKHKRVVDLINQGEDISAILAKEGMSRSNYNWIKKRYEDHVIVGKPLDLIDIDIEAYNSQLIDNSKYIALRIANTLKSKSMVGMSLNQLTNSLVSINNLVRLEQGKSTENIAHQVIHNLNDEQLKLIKESIMNLKKSMLS